MSLRLSGFVILVMLVLACRREGEDREPFWFRTHEATATGLRFNNSLTPTASFNMFKYMYFYNGAGIGAGDFNNDGKIDLFFAGNQVADALYLNEGGLRFRDITREAGLTDDGGWSTGVSVVDINNDGLLDIYICRVAGFEELQTPNKLLVGIGIDDKGVPHFADSTEAYGLAFEGFSTQAVFFDYDLDGDLDMFLMNHAVHHSGMFAERSRFLNTYSERSGDRLYRNDGGRFTDVTRSSGIHSSEIGYGLGAVVCDVNLDGYPDLYIGNDFHENDYLYINQGNGTFLDEATARMAHTSQFSMGVDVADINNDGWPEIVSMDMLPEDPYILKRSLGEDAHDIFKMKVRYGYQPQYARNNLQLNRGGGQFSEIGLYAGMYATDWSWAPLWIDFDHDGLRDLFVSNGIPKRLNDMDYVNFISDRTYQDKIRNNALDDKDLALIDRFPEIRLPNHFFRNKGQAAFEDISRLAENSPPTYSNGAVYADLDNDGDLDIVVSNIGAEALVYENRLGEMQRSMAVRISLQGSQANKRAVGAKLMLFCGDETLTAEKQHVRGFQSSMEIPLHLGIGSRQVDSAWLIWPDNRFQRLPLPLRDNSYTWSADLPLCSWEAIRNRLMPAAQPVESVASASGLVFRHTENPFNEFDREPLIPRMLSTEGPALAVGDINEDGLDDVFVGGARDQRPALFLQQQEGRFARSPQPALDADSAYEDVDAHWADVNGDGYADLLVVSGGNEFYGQDNKLQPRLYLNNGSGLLQRIPDAFEGLYMTFSCMALQDVNADGYPDIFIGGRAVPFSYGSRPSSYLLLNDGKGKFTDATRQLAPELADAGMVTDAHWVDVDKDGIPELVLSLEWDGIVMFRKDGDRYRKQYLTERKGWWQCLLPFDYNGDGHTDFIAGNLGLNSRLRATPKEPVQLYVADFDGNGRTEQVLTYYLRGREIPFANKDELQKQLPALKKRYLYAEDFAKAGLGELFPDRQLAAAIRYSADYMENAVLINNGKGQFSLQALPWQAQLTTYRAPLQVEANGDGLTDILLLGNFTENNVQMGRQDADPGMLLINRGAGRYEIARTYPWQLRGEVRKAKNIRINNRSAWLLACNNDSLQCIRPVPQAMTR